MYITFLVILIAYMGFLAAYMYAWPTLPDVDSLKQVQLQTPMRIYTIDGKLISEIGDKHRIPIHIEQIPEALNQALIATEDKRFYEHGGVDLLGLARVSLKLLLSGRKQGGGSTLTMQVARNFFLSFEQTFSRKFVEIFLSLKIEGALDKRKILELYWNKINFGNRAYGVGAAAQIYYGKTVEQLNLAQLALIAGIPKGPSTHNPVSNPTKAFNRRNHVLWRMYAENFIDKETYEKTIQEPITGRLHGAKTEVMAPYVAEMARQALIKQVGQYKAYNDGLKIYTTLRSDDQAIARTALRDGLIDYDRRHGYRGPEQKLSTEQMQSNETIQTVLQDTPEFGGLWPAVVLSVDQQNAEVLIKHQIGSQKPQFVQQTLSWEAINWAKKFNPAGRWTAPPKDARQILQAGDQVRVFLDEKNSWQLAQLPEANAAFVAINTDDGAVRALEGGFDFSLSKFNRVIQARRQPGSNIKPFIYSAALDKGFTAASIINDSPIVVVDDSAETIWRPKNDSNFLGPIRLRYALKKSINLVSIRILRKIGVNYAIDYLMKFGFPEANLPQVDSLALGTAQLTPLEVVGGYAAFANGGFHIEPYFIDHIEDMNGNYLFQATPKTACSECGSPPPASKLIGYPPQPVALTQQATRIVEPRNNYIMNSMLHSVITSGTAATRLRDTRSPLQSRLDVGGKTGTTNDNKDAWFSGFGGRIATTVWVGFDDANRSLGANEFGGRAALPIWQYYMESILKNRPDNPLPQPPGITTVRIDPETGKLASPDDKKAIFEIFRNEFVPKTYSDKPNNIDPFSQKVNPQNSLEDKGENKDDKDDKDIF